MMLIHVMTEGSKGVGGSQGGGSTEPFWGGAGGLPSGGSS